MRSKRYQKIKSKINKDKIYTLDEALDFVKENRRGKFDETIEIHFKLGINPQKTEQQVKGSVVLPAGAVKEKKIAAFVGPAKASQAKEAGADLIGGADLVEKIKANGKCDFDIVVAEPELMKSMAQIARILGPKGLMPSPKTGTIGEDIKKIITELKKGKITFKNDEGGNLHQAVGKASWEKEKIKANIEAFMTAVKKVKPSGIKGVFIKGIYLSSTMGPGLRIQL